MIKDQFQTHKHILIRHSGSDISCTAENSDLFS